VKGFKFKLQSVLEARKKTFENSQVEFAKVQHWLSNEIKKLDYLYKDLERTMTGFESIMNTGKIDPTMFFCHQNYIIKLKQDIRNQHELIIQIEEKLKEKNQIMLEALKQKTMMDKLREKAQEEFKKNIERLDMLNIDEIATNRYKKAG